MTKIVGTSSGTGNDVDSGALTATAAGVATSSSATQVVLDLGGGKTFTMTGTGFGGFDANGIPTTGTVTGVTPNNGGQWSQFSISVADLWTIFQNGDVNAFNNALFSGNDTFVSHDTGNTHETDDNFYGYGGNDTFNMQGANLHAFAEMHGGAGNDSFHFAGNFDPLTDTIDGGGGTADNLTLNGDYTGLVFTSTTMSNVELITLSAGHNYNITTNDATVAATRMLSVDGTALGSGDSLTFNGGSETNGKFTVGGGAGNDTLTGGARNDVFDLTHGGDDTASGGGGNDNFEMGAALTNADHIDGGAGTDILKLSGNYTDGVIFGPSTITNIETIRLIGGFSYHLTLNDANVAAGHSLTLDATGLGSSDSANFNGSAETDGRLILRGGAGSDTLVGGALGDTINGGGHADILTGGAGGDVFVYTSVSDSIGSANDGPAGSGFDTITDFNALADKINLPFTVTGISTAINGGPLHQPLFDTDLGNTLGSSQLAAYHAVLYSPSTGDYNGHTFLIVDGNGIAGYQSAGDVVIDVTGGTHLANLSTADFI